MTIRLACGYCFKDSEREIMQKLKPIAHNFDYIAAVDGRFEGYNSLQATRNKIRKLRRKLEYASKYEQWELIPKLELLQSKIIKMIDEYAPPNDYSLDKGPEILRSLGNCDVINYAGYQPDKRQRYLDACEGKDIDYLMILDTDEYPHPDFCDWEYFRRDLEEKGKAFPNQQVFYMWYWVQASWKKAQNRFSNNRWILPIRIVRNPASVRYAFGCHYYFMKKGDPEDGSAPNLKARGHRKTPLDNQGILGINKYIPDGVRLTADSVLRSKQSLSMRLAWANYGIWKERSILDYKSRELMKSKIGYHILMTAINKEKEIRKLEEKGMSREKATRKIVRVPLTLTNKE